MHGAAAAHQVWCCRNCLRMVLLLNTTSSFKVDAGCARQHSNIDAQVLALVPTAPARLVGCVAGGWPHRSRDAAAQCLALRGALLLAERPAAARGVREGLLAAAAEHLLGLDVEVRWEDIAAAEAGAPPKPGHPLIALSRLLLETLAASGATAHGRISSNVHGGCCMLPAARDGNAAVIIFFYSHRCRAGTAKRGQDGFAKPLKCMGCMACRCRGRGGDGERSRGGGHLRAGGADRAPAPGQQTLKRVA